MCTSLQKYNNFRNLRKKSVRGGDFGVTHMHIATLQAGTSAYCAPWPEWPPPDWMPSRERSASSILPKRSVRPKVT